MELAILFVIMVAVPTAIATWMVAKKLARATGLPTTDGAITVVFGRGIAKSVSVFDVQQMLDYVREDLESVTKKKILVTLNPSQDGLLQVFGSMTPEERDWIHNRTRVVIGRE